MEENAWGGVQLTKGFTFIELIVTCTLIVILSSLGYGFYQDHIIKTRRLEAQTALLEMAAAIERKYAELKAGNLYPAEVTFHGGYTLSIHSQTEESYTLQAIAPSASDKTCAVFLLTRAGEKTSKNLEGTLTHDCWQK